MTDTFLIIQTLGFTTGTLLFSLLAVLARRADRLTGRKHYGVWAALLGLLWNLGNLLKFVARLSGVALTTWPLPLVNAATYSALAFLPATLLFSLLARWDDGRSWPAQRRQRFVSLSVGALLTLGFFACALAPHFPLTRDGVLRLAVYNLMLHVLAGAWLMRGRTSGSPAPLFVRAELWLLAGLAALLFLMIHFALSARWEMTLEVVTQQSGIPIALISFVSLARFRFADVFIKRGFILLAALILALLYSWLALDPLLRVVRATAFHSEAAARIATTLSWGALLLSFPVLRRAINFAADRWLFRRPDYRRLSQRFAQESERVADEEDLFALATQHIQTTLAVTRAAVLPRAALPGLPAGGEHDIVQLPPDHPARNVAGAPEVELLLPIQANAVISHFLGIAPGREGRELLSDELAFLTALAERIGRRLEALHFERERRTRELREARLQHSLTQAELKALQAQINPHFLFNTLNTIADLISSEPARAELMTERLAEVFRYVLARTQHEFNSASEEFDFLRNYLAIEQARFGERLRVELTIDSSAANAQLPSLLLQPLVENAIKHGLAPQRAGGTLRVRALTEGGNLQLIVEDNGAGWRAAPAAVDVGVGLRNVRERLQALYGDRAQLEISSAPAQGTRISMTIPQDETQNLDRGRRSGGEIAAEEARRRAS